MGKTISTTQYTEWWINDYEYPIKNLTYVILNTSLNQYNFIFYATDTAASVNKNTHGKFSTHEYCDDNTCSYVWSLWALCNYFVQRDLSCVTRNKWMNELENFKFKYYPRSYQFDNLFRSAINGVSESIKAGGDPTYIEKSYLNPFSSLHISRWTCQKWSIWTVFTRLKWLLPQIPFSN